MQDIGGDEFGSMDDIGIHEIAQLSLNEPEIEIIVFTDARGVGDEGGMHGERGEDIETSD